MADDQTQFETLLGNLLNLDKNVRTQSEEMYSTIPAPNKMTFLIGVLQNTNASVPNRSLAAVLLRKLFTAKFDDAWSNLVPDSQIAIKTYLMNIIHQEANPVIRKKVCDAIAELARNMLDEEGNMTWPDILKFLLECASSEDPRLKESALHIFSSVPGVFGVAQNQYLNTIKRMLMQCLQDKTIDVRYEAVRATTAFVIANEKQINVLNHFRELLPDLTNGVAESVNSDHDDCLLKCLIELADNVPKFLRSHLELILPFCMKVVANREADNHRRQLSLEVIVALSETAPAMVRKNWKYIPNLVLETLALMIDLEEDLDWAQKDEADDDDIESNAIVGENALDRLACALGGKTILPPIVSHIPQMLTNSDWRYRHAALMAISACGEGCHCQMEQMLANIVDTVLPYLKDTHPRVRYATCNALGQLSTDFGPNFQKKFHDKVVDALLITMDDDENPRVQAHAAAALVNFSDDCPKSILLEYLDKILGKLEHVLNKKLHELVEIGCKLVLEQVVSTLAAVADTAEEKFVLYYDKFMPCLKYIVQNATSTELRLLRGKTIECISLIGLAVGKEKFMQDCSEVMQLLLKTQTDMTDLPDDDPQISYMISAWARMCKILGTEFQRYLPMVMGPVLKAVAIQPDVAVVNSDDMKEMEDDTDWQFVTLGDQQSIGVRTSGLEEKATACQMIVCYAKELKEGFAEYTEEVVRLIVPLLKFVFHDDVRVSAAESLPYLLECARIKGDQYVAEMWNYICPNLLKAIMYEPERAVVPDHLASLAKCIENLGKGCLSQEHMCELVAIIDSFMKDHFCRQEERIERRKDEDFDEVAEEELQEEDLEDVYILSKISDTIHALFGTHKKEFIPIFDAMSHHFAKLLNPDRPWADRQWGLCVWDDVIEHTDVAAIKYQDLFVPQMVQSICDKHPEVRQAASYGIGVMAMFAEPAFHEVCVKSLPMLVKVIQLPASREPENLSATENIISAVTKICKYCPNHVNVDDILPHWLSWLPIWEDEDEAEHIYDYLCDLIQNNNMVILGENNSNLPRIFDIMATTFHKEVLKSDNAVYQRMVGILRQVETNIEVFTACVSQLSDNQRNTLSAVLASPPITN
ncbi:importin-5-like [Argonauta hians]